MTTEYFRPPSNEQDWGEWGAEVIAAPFAKAAAAMFEGMKLVKEGEAESEDPATATPPQTTESTPDEGDDATTEKSQQPDLIDPDTGRPLGIPVVQGSDEEGAAPGGGEDQGEEEEEDEDAVVPMDLSSMAASQLAIGRALEKTSKVKKAANSLRAIKAASGVGTKPGATKNSAALMSTVSMADSTPRMLDTLTFRNKQGEQLYRAARAQLEPYAKISFGQALKARAIHPHELLVSSLQLAASMRMGVPFANALFAYSPDKQGSRARSVSVAASQLGQAFRHVVLPAGGAFLFSRGDEDTPAAGVANVEVLKGKSDPTPPISEVTKQELLNPKTQVVKDFDESQADRDQFNNLNIPSLRHGRGEMTVILENIAKSTVLWVVQFYRGSVEGQKYACHRLDENEGLFVATLNRAKLFESPADETKALEVVVDRNRLAFDQAEDKLTGAKVIIADDLGQYYNRKAGSPLVIDDPGTYYNRKTDRNAADRDNSKEMEALLARILGDAETAKYWWSLYSRAEIAMWDILRAEGESDRFDKARRQYVYIAFQLGYLIDGRTRIFLQSHCDTEDEDLYEQFEPNDVDDDSCPKKCPPKKKVCKPRCVTHVIYVEPAPCVEYVEPDCVDRHCRPHCVEPCPPPPCPRPDPCAPKVCPPPPCPPKPCPPADPCDMYETILVPEPEHCGPPCQNEPELCMKKACTKGFGGSEYDGVFLIKAHGGCHTDESIDKRLRALCAALNCFVTVTQPPRSEEQQIAQAASLAGAIIDRLNNKSTRDEVHMFSTACKQMLWILFWRLYCLGTCKARLLMIEIADFTYGLSVKPEASGAKIKSSNEASPVVAAFVDYIQNGERSKELSEKFQLVEYDAPYMLPEKICTPYELFHTLRGFLDAVQDKINYELDKDLDELERDFIRGEWDYIYKRMVAKMGPDYKPKSDPKIGEDGWTQTEKPVKVTVVERKPSTPVTVVAVPGATPAPARTATTTTTTTTTTTVTNATPAVAGATPAAPGATPAAPANPTTTAVTGTTPMLKQNALVTPKKPVVNYDDDEEASDEFDKHETTSATTKNGSIDDLLERYSK